MKKILLSLPLLVSQMAFAYTVSITEPAEERAYQRPAQSVDVAVSVSPKLEDGASVHILVGDVNLGVGERASIPTTELNPGAYQIQAIVIDGKGNRVATAERTIHVIQNTRIVQQRRVAQKAYDDYQALPWYRKMILNMHQDFTPPAKPN